MKIRLTLPFLLALFLLPFLHSQNRDIDSVKNAYTNYFELPRQKAHLQLNKSVYLKGEEIWFAAYLYDIRTGKPAVEPTNLYCGIYNSEGKELIKEVFPIEGGMGSGHILIDSTWATDELYIRAHTNWMRNFKEDGAYQQELTVLGDGDVQPVADSIESITYNVEFLPEGGHLVQGLENSVGFRITDQNGKGSPIKSGQILNDLGEVVVNDLTSNEYGIGKFIFSPQKNRSYITQIRLSNGSEITGQLPKAEEKGITLSINNLIEDRLAIALAANEETYPELKGNDLYLAVHQNGIITLTEFQLDEGRKTVLIGKDRLLPGINIITLFGNDLRPIAERLFYNDLNKKSAEIAVDLERPTFAKDSVRIKLNLYSEKNSPISLSVSVLPEETLAGSGDQSILSSFLLKPYLKSAVEHPAHYFREMDRKKSFELDNLLLTQGWSRYEWDDIFKNPPKENFPNETGFELKGTLLNIKYDPDHLVMLSQSDADGFRLLPTDPKNRFSIEHLNIIKGDTLQFSLVNRKGQTKKPSVNVNFFPKMDTESIPAIKSMELLGLSDNVSEKSIALRDIVEDNTIALDNVTVTEKKIENTLKRTHGPTVGMEGKKITKDEVTKSPQLEDLLRRLGFRITTDVNGKKVLLAKSNVPPPVVYFDGSVVFNINRDINILEQLPFQFFMTPTNMIDEVYYEHLSGLDGSLGGTIYIDSKYGSGMVQEEVAQVAKVLATEGFSRPRQYYNPKFSSYNNEDYLEYGTVHWEPSLKIGTNGTGEMNFPDYGLKNVKLFIEGMAEDGTLVSEIKILSLN